MLKTKLLGVVGITFAFFAIVSPAYSQTQGGEKPKAKLFDEVIKDEASADVVEEAHPEVFAGFDDEMAARNAGKESGDVEFPVDWKTFNELEAEARGEKFDRDLNDELRSRQERFGQLSPEADKKIRESRDRKENELLEGIREREGPPAERPQVRDDDPRIEHYPNTAVQTFRHPEHTPGIFPTYEFANPDEHMGYEDALRVIDAEQDIRQDLEEGGDGPEYVKPSMTSRKSLIPKDWLGPESLVISNMRTGNGGITNEADFIDQETGRSEDEEALWYDSQTGELYPRSGESGVGRHTNVKMFSDVIKDATVQSVHAGGALDLGGDDGRAVMNIPRYRVR